MSDLQLNNRRIKLIELSRKLIKHKLFSSSLIMIIGSNIANFMAYLYHVVMGRALGPSAYGELSAAISIMALILAFFNFMGIAIVKFTSQTDDGERTGMIKWLGSIASRSSIIISLMLLLSSPWLSRFLKVDLMIVLLLIPITVFGIYSFVYRSFLQGILKFKEFVLSLNADIFSRLIFGILFIYIGWSTFGAVLAIVVAFFMAFLVARYALINYLQPGSTGEFLQKKDFLRYSLPVLVTSVAANSMLSSDLILTKHYFDPHLAGIYASLSTLGKIIFYGAGPVSWVMFPMIAKMKNGKGNHRKLFLLSLLLTLGISLGVTGIYYLFPSLAIRILYGSEFLEGGSYLIYFGVYMTIFTVTTLFTNYYLSRNITKIAMFSIIAALMQILGIAIFHSGIVSVISVSIAAASLYLTVLLAYYITEK